MSDKSIKILYGTETGNSQDLAERTSEKLSEIGWETETVNVRDYEASSLADESHIILVISTWGEGVPPEDAYDFHDDVVEGDMDLSKMSFCVLALGDTEYEEYCACGKRLDQHFERLGGKRFMDRTDLDADYEGDFAEWLDKLVQTLGN